MYIIQKKLQPWHPWQKLNPTDFKTYEEAKVVYDNMPFKETLRIAKAYTVTHVRYKEAHA